MRKRCLFCGRFFIADRRVGDRQKACHREPCKQKRKRVAQRRWCENNPGYFQGRYPYVQQWRERRKSSGTSGPGMIHDKIPTSKPCLRLILVMPGDDTRRDPAAEAESVYLCGRWVGIDPDTRQDRHGKRVSLKWYHPD